jgi:hypothetical protein
MVASAMSVSICGKENVLILSPMASVSLATPQLLPAGVAFSGPIVVQSDSIQVV